MVRLTDRPDMAIAVYRGRLAIVVSYETKQRLMEASTYGPTIMALSVLVDSEGQGIHLYEIV